MEQNIPIPDNFITHSVLPKFCINTIKMTILLLTQFYQSFCLLLCPSFQFCNDIKAITMAQKHKVFVFELIENLCHIFDSISNILVKKYLSLKLSQEI